MSKKDKTRKYSLKRKILFSFVTFVISAILVFFILEIIMEIFSPKGYLYPRYKFSKEYGHVLYENQIIEHYNPPYKKIYTTNKYGLRGKIVPVSNSYNKLNIILLGDSFTFGIGVNDGNEFASIMSEKLKNDYNIINTAVGGWGLTQQVRKYYEFGQLYNPEIVILVFCGNDPEDNFNNKVTIIEDGRFKFQDSNNSINWIKKYLSKSVIQKSNVYNMLRNSIYLLFRKKITGEAIDEHIFEASTLKNKKEINPMEQFYNEILELFAKDLYNRSIKLIMFSINELKNNGEIFCQLENYQLIENKVTELDSLGYLDYININECFNDPVDFKISPVGHYDKRWNILIGNYLSEIIMKQDTCIKDTIKSTIY